MVEVLYLHGDLRPNLGYEDKVYHQPKKLSLLKKIETLQCNAGLATTGASRASSK